MLLACSPRSPTEQELALFADIEKLNARLLEDDVISSRRLAGTSAATRFNLDKLVVKNQTIEDIEWTWASINNAEFHNVIIENALIKKSKMHDTIFSNVHFKNTTFENSSSIEATFDNVTFENCTFSGLSAGRFQASSIKILNSKTVPVDHLDWGILNFTNGELHLELDNVEFDNADFIFTTGPSTFNIRNSTLTNSSFGGEFESITVDSVKHDLVSYSGNGGNINITNSQGSIIADGSDDGSVERVSIQGGGVALRWPVT